MKKYLILLAFCAGILSACQTSIGKAENKSSAPVSKDSTVPEIVTNDQITNSAADILAKKQVPVLCFHHIRDIHPGQRESTKAYFISPAKFAQLMKALKDSGYETILPDQLYDYLLHNGKLPAKPVLLTFDDTDEEQFTIAYQDMKKYGFKGVFFIMTVSINRPHYMTKEQIKQLADEGNAVESHTWDHHDVRKYQGTDWETQFVKPRKTIEDITGKTATYFAYPFGAWNKAAIPELKKAGFKMAFILSTKRDSSDPLFTVRRMLVPDLWSTQGTMNSMKRTFHLD